MHLFLQYFTQTNSIKEEQYIMKNTFHNCQNICKLADWVCLININTYLSTSSGILFLDIVIVTACHKIWASVSLGMCNDKNNKAKRFTNKRYFIPVKIENSTCEFASVSLGTLFLCCVRVVNQNTRALLLLVFCYSYATWHVPVPYLTTYTRHEKREAKEMARLSNPPK